LVVRDARCHTAIHGMAVSDQDAHRNGHILAPVLNATTLRTAAMDKTAKADSTLKTSQAVPYPSTSRALCRIPSEVTMERVKKLKSARGDVHMSSVRNMMLDLSNPHHDACSVRHCAQIQKSLKLVATDTSDHHALVQEDTCKNCDMCLSSFRSCRTHQPSLTYAISADDLAYAPRIELLVE
jgi:hypothetical protein